MKYENEQKYRVSNVRKIRQRLLALKAKLLHSSDEFNEIYDQGNRLRMRGCLLRLRHHKMKSATLTYKGPAVPSLHKRRMEIETSVEVASMRLILKKLGFKQVAGYEKKRSEYRIGRNLVTLDFLVNAGWFMEIEGSDNEIRKLAKRLGLGDHCRETRNYLMLSSLSKRKAGQ